MPPNSKLNQNKDDTQRNYFHLLPNRKRLDNTVHDMLVAPYIPSSMVKLLVDLFNCIHLDDEERITIMAEIIADVREPITQVEVEISDEEKRKKELKVGELFDYWCSKGMVMGEEVKAERWEKACVHGKVRGLYSQIR